jgi:hypothetical protein
LNSWRRACLLAGQPAQVRIWSSICILEGSECCQAVCVGCSCAAMLIG